GRSPGRRWGIDPLVGLRVAVYVIRQFLEVGPAAPRGARFDRPPQAPSWIDSAEVVMLESRSAWRSSKTSRVLPGRASRTPVARSPIEEKSMAQPLRLCLCVFLVIVSVAGATGLVAPTTAEAQKKILNIAAK